MFKWGILGPGRIAHQFAQSLSNIEDIQIYAVASHSLKKAQAFAKEHSIPKAFGNYEELVACKEIDAVYIATLNPYHHEPTIFCLNNKKPVLCEKPFSLNSDFSKKMIDAAKENNTFLMEAMWTRFLPAISDVRKWISQGLIGDVRSVKASFSFNVDGNPEDRWLNLEQGGGSLLDLGIYPLSFACMILGTDYKDICSFGNLTHTGVDEHCFIGLNYNNGAIAQLYSSLSSTSPNNALISGTKGYIEIENFYCASSANLIIDRKVHDSVSYDYDKYGLQFEAIEVQKQIEKGNLQSDKMTWDDTLKIMKIIDIAKENMGLKYPQE